jgi:hypothetical protein
MNSLFLAAGSLPAQGGALERFGTSIAQKSPKDIKCAGTAYQDHLSLRELRSRASLRFRLSETRYSRYRKGALSAARG